jgi:molybdopterin-guanine dinucleotide biosynthesis protein A
MDRSIVAVLAGGDSTRMGSDKAAVLVGGSTMLDIVLETAGVIGDPVVIGRSVAPEGVPAVPDEREGSRGPLTGLETALKLHPDRVVVLIAVDHPFVRADTIEHLLATEGDAVIPFHEGWQQVTCAVYRPAFLAAATAVLDSGCRSIITALDMVDATLVGEDEWRAWGEDGRSWFSVDSPDRLDEGLRRYG